MAKWSYLHSATDLLQKLQHDLKQMKDEPGNVYKAFNFFVTAWHMVDWTYPNDKEKQTQLRHDNVLLQVCSHLANGFKHFEVDKKRHQSVQQVKRDGVFGDVFGDVFGQVFGGELIVYLDGHARNEFGEKITALKLAEALVAFWEAHMANSSGVT